MGHTEESSFYDEEGTYSSGGAGHNLMMNWLEASDRMGEVRRGDLIEGTIVSISPTEILVDVNCKADGIVSGRELERLSPEELAELAVGDRIPVFVVSPEDRDGNIVLSLSRAHSQRDWRRAQELFDSEAIFEERVSGCNKGGVIVNIGRLRGFVPASQLTPGTYENSKLAAGKDDDHRWEHLIGDTLKLKVIELDRNRNRLILSEKAAAREWRQSARDKLLSQLRVGSVCKGVITTLCDFGAFVDLGGADGLIHLSELSWGRVEHPRDVVEEGQEVEVYVLDIDQEKQRIGLSLRRLLSEPWEEVVKTLSIGQVVEGVITKIVPFGAFAQIGDHVEGLIHISELADGRVNHPHEVVKEGDVVPLKIIRIDAERRRVGLSLKQAREDADFDWREEYQQSLKENEAAEAT